MRLENLSADLVSLVVPRHSFHLGSNKCASVGITDISEKIKVGSPLETRIHSGRCCYGLEISYGAVPLIIRYIDLETKGQKED